jgi:hypothetical protein
MILHQVMTLVAVSLPGKAARKRRKEMDQLSVLANYIIQKIPGEPSEDEGAGSCAIRLMQDYRKALQDIMNELGVPQPGYAAPVANAYDIAKKALG